MAANDVIDPAKTSRAAAATLRTSCWAEAEVLRHDAEGLRAELRELHCAHGDALAAQSSASSEHQRPLSVCSENAFGPFFSL